MVLRQYTFDTMTRLQELYLQTGKRPRLRFSEELVVTAERFVNRVGHELVPIVLHLKNMPRHRGRSNALLDCWLEFLARTARRKPQLMFLLIGDDEIPTDVLKLPNVVRTRHHGGGLALDLALIGVSAAFMGMASGPCNAAILSDVPYAIYKHPKHHATQMAAELGGRSNYAFALESQKLHRQFETPGHLSTELNRLLASARRSMREDRE